MSDGDDEDVEISGGAAAPEPDSPEPVAAGYGGAPDDQEMPLTVHIEEMVRRLGKVIVLMAIVSAITFPFADELINFLWYSFLPGSQSVCPGTGGGGSSTAACPRLYHPLALVLARLKVASLVGFIFALPMFVYQTYRFMRPGLYPHERRYYLASVPTSLILAGVGVAFAYFLILPLLFTYFLGYSQPVADVAFGLSETFGLILLMLGMFALIFQIPLFVMLAIMMGVTTRRWLESRRLYFWAGFGGVAFIFSPDPTGMAPFMVATTMVVLFEGTLALLRWSGEGSMTPGVEEIAGLRPFVWLLALVGGYLASPLPLPEGIYGDLPAVLTSTLESAGLAGAASVLVFLLVLVAYEGFQLFLGRVAVARGDRRLYRARMAVLRVRLPAWLLAIGLGYLASPGLRLHEQANQVLLSRTEAAVAVVGVILVYEAAIALGRWRS